MAPSLQSWTGAAACQIPLTESAPGRCARHRVDGASALSRFSRKPASTRASAPLGAKRRRIRSRALDTGRREPDCESVVLHAPIAIRHSRQLGQRWPPSRPALSAQSHGSRWEARRSPRAPDPVADAHRSIGNGSARQETGARRTPVRPQLSKPGSTTWLECSTPCRRQLICSLSDDDLGGQFLSVKSQISERLFDIRTHNLEIAPLGLRPNK